VNLPGQDEQAALVMGGKPSPFGMDVELLRRCTPFPSSVRLRGLHAHLASGVGADGLLAAAGRLVSFGRQWCAEQGVTEPEFNLGGGMAVDYTRPDGVFDWAGYGRGLAGLARPGETLRIEPGRAVTAYCGWYLTRVLDVKHSHGEAFAVVAGGTHHLRTPAAKGHDQPFAVIAVDDWAPPWPRPGIRDEAVTIAGQLCTPKDVLARRARIGRPRALRVGDLVAFGAGRGVRLEHLTPRVPHAPAARVPLPTMNMIKHGSEVDQRGRCLRARRGLPLGPRALDGVGAGGVPGLAADRAPGPLAARGGRRRAACCAGGAGAIGGGVRRAGAPDPPAGPPPGG
jgi:hypothetical protein